MCLALFHFAWRCLAWHCLVLLGVAWPGFAWLGLAWRLSALLCLVVLGLALPAHRLAAGFRFLFGGMVLGIADLALLGFVWIGFV